MISDKRSGRQSPAKQSIRNLAVETRLQRATKQAGRQTGAEGRTAHRSHITAVTIVLSSTQTPSCHFRHINRRQTVLRRLTDQRGTAAAAAVDLRDLFTPCRHCLDLYAITCPSPPRPRPHHLTRRDHSLRFTG